MNRIAIFLLILIAGFVVYSRIFLTSMQEGYTRDLKALAEGEGLRISSLGSLEAEVLPFKATGTPQALLMYERHLARREDHESGHRPDNFSVTKQFRSHGIVLELADLNSTQMTSLRQWAEARISAFEFTLHERLITSELFLVEGPNSLRLTIVPGLYSEGLSSRFMALISEMLKERRKVEERAVSSD